VSDRDGVVTVCIPAYQAAGFIDRTLRCARGQTHEAQRIVVSVDVSEDDTEEICRAHAGEDERVEVHAHRERQKWVGNVNFLLDRVGSEYAFIYFHDDVIEPTYCERLVGVLAERPDAASSHCDVILDGPDGERLRVGREYEGSAAVRLLTHFLSPDRGAVLRSMVRRAGPAGPLRMTLQGAQYEMALVAAGPALRVAEPLYRRFDQRVGGLTAGWRRLPFDHFVEGLRYNASMAEELIDGLRPSAAERELLEFGLAVFITNRLRTLETTHDVPQLTPLTDVLRTATELRLPAAVAGLPDDLAARCTEALERARRRTARRARRLAEREAP
jgi:glycosyltransferase involved in cell wall biosynthesis